jgi:hypothetical protein
MLAVNSTFGWAGALVIGVAATVLGAVADAPKLHMALTAAVCCSFVLLGVVQRRRLLAAGASGATLSSATATAMAVVWLWAAASLFSIYTLVSTWGEWWQYVLGAAVVALLCLFFSVALSRDAVRAREDATMLSLARYLTIGQLAGMVIAMVGLVADAKMPRDPRKPDWAASAIFFFGAAALATISADALRRTTSSRKT